MGKKQQRLTRCGYTPLAECEDEKPGALKGQMDPFAQEHILNAQRLLFNIRNGEKSSGDCSLGGGVGMRRRTRRMRWCREQTGRA